MQVRGQSHKPAPSPFENLPLQTADRLLRLKAVHCADTREEIIEIGVDAYRNTNDRTPVHRAFTEAEARLLDWQTTKTILDRKPTSVSLVSSRA